jgi:hypothetical protein
VLGVLLERIARPVMLPRAGRVRLGPDGRAAGGPGAALIASAGLIFIAALWWKPAQGLVSSYLWKWGEAPGSIGSAFERAFASYLETRQTRAISAWASFVQSPWLGTGFGLAAGLYADPSLRREVFGLTASAPTEWGNIYMGLLAETGVLGASAFVWFLLTLLASGKPLVKGALIPAITVFVSAFAEATLFSMGGLATVQWLALSSSLRSQPRTHCLRIRWR